jgi:hypothetical protein
MTASSQTRGEHGLVRHRDGVEGGRHKDGHRHIQQRAERPKIFEVGLHRANDDLELAPVRAGKTQQRWFSLNHRSADVPLLAVVLDFVSKRSGIGRNNVDKAYHFRRVQAALVFRAGSRASHAVPQRRTWTSGSTERGTPSLPLGSRHCTVRGNRMARPLSPAPVPGRSAMLSTRVRAGSKLLNLAIATAISPPWLPSREDSDASISAPIKHRPRHHPHHHLAPGGCSGCGRRRCVGRTWSSRPPAGRRRSRRTPRGLGRALRRRRGS